MRSAIDCLTLLLFTATTAPTINASEGHTRRRMEVAPLNTFVKIKDEFDARIDAIEKLVFQTLNAFSMNDGELMYV
jgi:hypothetical protein